MAERKVTAARKRALIEGLREASREGRLVPGDMLPRIRDLADQYDLATRTVLQELQPLVDAGVLRSVPRVGIFLAKPLADNADLFVMVTPPPDTQRQPRPSSVQAMRVGFEQRIAELGASSSALNVDDAANVLRAGSLPGVAGLFDASGEAPDVLDTDKTMPQVWYATFVAPRFRNDRPVIDTVRFDDVGGGRAATQHLIDRGHSAIAFLGLHRRPGTVGYFTWSQRRMVGWREAVEAAGLPSRGLAFLPDAEAQSADEEITTAARAAERLVARAGASAVVCANDRAALGLFDALRSARVPHERWPSVVGFDDLPDARASVLTSVRPPFEAVGQTAAELLWERRTGKLAGDPVLRPVAMRLIPRISSRPSWPVGVDGVIGAKQSFNVRTD